MTHSSGEEPSTLSRDWLALERTRLANERTALAYARTAIMLAATGVSLLNFFNDGPVSRVIGWGLIIAALAVGFAGRRRFRSLARSLVG